MSLVNDMLRDLDRRRQLPVQAHRVGRVIDIADELPRTRAAHIALLVLASLAAGLAGGYFLMERPRDPARDLALEVAAPAMQAEAPAAVLEPAPAPELRRLEVAEVVQSDTDFTLRLRGNQPIEYSITDRNNNGMTLRFEGLEAYDDRGESISGLSVIQMPDYTLFELELPADADLKLYEADDAAPFELVLSARYREPLASTLRQPVAVAAEPAPATSADEAAGLAAADTALAAATAPAATAINSAPLAAAAPGVMGLQATAPTGTGTRQRALDASELPLRVTRGLTLEQQDRNASQSAVALVQSGRLLEAYEGLLTFLARNPEAHTSRETLGTILLAQREVAQATAVVEEGLRLAPNYAPYKKIKARLLLQEGRSAEALQLLEQVPPSLQADKEYHELLATLYQQNSQHGKAIATYQELLRTNSSEGRWWAGLGISLEAQGDTQKAVASYQAALQQGNLDPGVRQYSQGRIRSLGVQ